MHIRNLLTLILALVFTASMTAVAAGDDAAESNRVDDGACFQTKRVHTIRRLDEFHAVAELLGGSRFVVGVEERCRGLDNAVQFTITSRGTRVCPASFAELYFSERSGRSERCRIETVELLSDQGSDVEERAEAEDSAG